VGGRVGPGRPTDVKGVWVSIIWLIPIRFGQVTPNVSIIWLIVAGSC
jgi:hypothetical protein